MIRLVFSEIRISICAALAAVAALCLVAMPGAWAQAPFDAADDAEESELGVQAYKRGDQLTLDWNDLAGIDSYEVEISDDNQFIDTRSFMVNESRLVFTVPKDKYLGNIHWRFKITNNGKVSTTPWYSSTTTPVSDAPPPAPSPTPAPKSKKAAKPKPPWRKWIWFGTGYNYVNYQQTIPIGDISYEDFRGLSQFVEFGMAHRSGYGLLASFKNTPGDVAFENYPIDQNRYNWKTISLEVLRSFNAPFRIYGMGLTYGARAGLQHHMVPFVHLDASNKALLRENTVTTGSLGALAELRRKQIRFYWYMRYQMPVATPANFSVYPKLAFDGLVGLSYDLSPRWKVGGFWYGQWHQFDFSYRDDTSYSGFQSLFYSNMDLRIGYEF